MKKRIFAVVCLGVLWFAPDAFAVVGRPLTPLSYAGVARRTTRRAVASTTVVAAPVAVPVATHPITTLPAGCAQSVSGATTYYNCGSTRYRAVYNGGSLVYVTP